jgi:hypothetical protein
MHDVFENWDFDNPPTKEQLENWDKIPWFLSQMRHMFKKDKIENYARDKHYSDIVHYYCGNNKAWFRLKNW